MKVLHITKSQEEILIFEYMVDRLLAEWKGIIINRKPIFKWCHITQFEKTRLDKIKGFLKID